MVQRSIVFVVLSAALSGACLESREGQPADGSPAGDATETGLEPDRDVAGDVDGTAPGPEVVPEVEAPPPDGGGEASAERPMIQLTPGAISFGRVQAGVPAQKSLNVSNVGARALRIDRFTLSGHPGFELIIGVTRYPVSPDSAAGIELDSPIVIEPGMSMPISLRFVATDAGPAEGRLVLFSNDPLTPDGSAVALDANVGGPCIAIDPRAVAFGGRLVGRLAEVRLEITSCGDDDLELTAIELSPDSARLFSLSLAGVPGLPPSATYLDPNGPPLVLARGETARITVQYFPEAVSAIDGDGRPLLDKGAIRIGSNAFQAVQTVELSGFGVVDGCPNAVITVREGEEVIPQTLLHLSGARSWAATAGEIVGYEWQVQQPVGSTSVFFPSRTAAEPTFEANVAGRYLFTLTVTDSSGARSCVPAVYEVFVNPPAAIHIELLWRTPLDTDPIDELGADLDLHFTHNLADGGYDLDGDGRNDGWFDLPFDCFWANEAPNWGLVNPAVYDNPSLDRDDTDGLGPENLNLSLPESGATYRVGVHYWDARDYGTSFATVRVFIFGNLVFEAPDVELSHADLWTVTTIAWPLVVAPVLAKVCAGTTTPCTSDAQCAAGCGPRIAPNYRHPNFTPP